MDLNKEGILLLGGSSGSLEAMKRMLPLLTKDFPFNILIIQHMPKTFELDIPNSIQKYTILPAKWAKNGEKLSPGTVYIAPALFQTRIIDYKFVINEEDHGFSFRPSVDLAFSSAAGCYGENTIGAILSGMSVESDGVIGCFSIKQHGGRTFAQDKESSTIFGMPKKAIDAGVIDEVLPPDIIMIKILLMLKAS